MAEKKAAKVSLEDAAREALRVLSALPAVSEKELRAAATALAGALSD